MILLNFANKEDLPFFLTDLFWSELFFATIYTFLLVFPISLARTIGKLTYASAAGVLCTFYVAFVVTIIFFVNRNLVPNPWDNFKGADYFKVKFDHLIFILVFF